MRNAIVTGGSRGLGLSIARRLTECGWRAIVVARRESEQLLSARAAAQEAARAAARTDIEDTLPEAEPLPFVPFDLAAVAEIPELVRCLRRRFGPIAGLVNNAGISTEGLLAMTSSGQIEQVVRLNTVSPIVLTKYVVRAMMADGAGGRIVNISSITATSGHSGLSVYAASKASLQGFTRSLAREVGRLGITVNAVAPGFVETDLTATLTAEQRAQLERRSALKRLVRAEDVAHAVEFLLSERASSITGTVLTVDGGSTA